MALFKILRGNKNNLPQTYKEGYMYITEDTGDIYVDISNSKRIQLNADSASRVRKIQTNGTEVDFTYDEINTKFNSKLNSANPSITGTITIGSGTTAKLTTDGDTSNLYLNGKAILTTASNKWTNNSNTITINGVVLDADKTDGEEGDTLTIATKEYVNDQISDMATTSYVDSATADMATKTYVDGQTSDMATKSYVTTEIAKIPTIYSDIGEPDESLGKVGDIYIQLAEEG